MSSNCNFHKFGHCRLTTSCTMNHNFPHCPLGIFCPQKLTCQYRHVKDCPLSPKCPYPKCSYYHPLTIPPPVPIPYLFSQPPPWTIPLPTPIHPPYQPGLAIPTPPAQSLDNGTTGNIRMDEEAPAVQDILTIQDDSSDTNSENNTIAKLTQRIANLEESNLALHKHIGELITILPKPEDAGNEKARTVYDKIDIEIKLILRTH